MINIWLSIITFYVMLCGFSYSYLLSHVNRTFLLLPRGIMENSIVILEANTFEKPFFDCEYLKKAVIDYFNVNLKDYVASYDISFYFFKSNDNYANSEHFDGVSIGLKTALLFAISYSNDLTFTITNHG